MQVGALRNLVQLQQLAGGRDAAGQPVQTWSTVADVWADIRHPSGLESIKADALTSVVRASIRIRRRTDVTAAMRVQHGPTLYEIKAVLQDQANRQYTDLVCEVVS